MRTPVALQRLIALQKWLAWGLPAVCAAATVVFFILLASGSAFLARPVLGPFLSRSVIVAAADLLAMIASVWIYGLLATVIERRAAKPDGQP
ncbi:MAG TPA: hypothetical protein VLX90_19805 [Steroidobacteraceae bacterium]|nr:hypothetical protein [Steroidobacteraceae bacterium]